MFNFLAEPNRTKSYKFEQVLFKTLESPYTLFPKIWNSFELELKSAKSFKKSRQIKRVSCG